METRRQRQTDKYSHENDNHANIMARDVVVKKYQQVKEGEIKDVFVESYKNHRNLLYLTYVFLNLIDLHLCPRVTSADSFNAHPATCYQPILIDCLFGIFAAAWIVAAEAIRVAAAEQTVIRRKRPLIQADQSDGNFAGKLLERFKHGL
jgi:hypothetical protein